MLKYQAWRTHGPTCIKTHVTVMLYCCKDARVSGADGAEKGSRRAERN